MADNVTEQAMNEPVASAEEATDRAEESTEPPTESAEDREPLPAKKGFQPKLSLTPWKKSKKPEVLSPKETSDDAAVEKEKKSFLPWKRRSAPKKSDSEEPLSHRLAGAFGLPKKEELSKAPTKVSGEAQTKEKEVSGARRRASSGHEVTRMFQRFGSRAFPVPDHPFKKFFDAGFTGETYADFDRPLTRDDPITILHFNDVYNIEQGADGEGGVSRFVSAFRSYAHKNPLILFSGDLFNPSSISTTTKGWHMIPVLKMLKVHTACMGNHDFDFGVDHLEYLAGSSPCPWLLSNVFEADCPSRPLADGKRYRLLQWQGYNVGIMGLVEREWLETLAMIDMDEVRYVDYVEEARELVSFFKSRDVDFIIALTHMRAHNDQRLANEVPEIDLLLGGHDHEYFGCCQIGRTVACKSGTDFREFTALEIYPGESLGLEQVDEAPNASLTPLTTAQRTHAARGHRIAIDAFGGSTLFWKLVEVTSQNFHTNRHVDKVIHKYVEELARQTTQILGYTSCELEARFAIVRTQETNTGNWLSDLMRQGTKADIAMLNSGTLRADRLFESGPFTVGDLVSLLPMPDPLVVLELSGLSVRQALENSVCMWPAREGRFLQLAGVKFEFDPEQPSGSRVLSVKVQSWKSDTWDPLVNDKTYRVVTKDYLASGKDGFECFLEGTVALDSESTPNLHTLIQNCFTLQLFANEVKAPGTRMAQALVKKMTIVGDSPSKLQCAHSMLKTQNSGHFKVYAKVEGRTVNVRTDS